MNIDFKKGDRVSVAFNPYGKMTPIAPNAVFVVRSINRGFASLRELGGHKRTFEAFPIEMGNGRATLYRINRVANRKQGAKPAIRQISRGSVKELLSEMTRQPHVTR